MGTVCPGTTGGNSEQRGAVKCRSHLPTRARVKFFLIRALRTISDSKKRSGIVMSLNARNESSRTVLIVPCPSDLTAGETPIRIRLPAEEGGLEEDPLALCDTISAIRKSCLERSSYG